MTPYLRRFIDSFNTECIISLFNRYHNATKEITESWGMWEASKNHVPDVSSHKVIVVGDGSSPRTGSIFAYFSKADVISIDPQINILHYVQWFHRQTLVGNKPQRLNIIKSKIEDVILDCGGKPTIVVWPHSHANMDNLRLTNCSSRTDIAMPCCVPIPTCWTNKPHKTYVDHNILSPQNTVHIWRT